MKKLITMAISVIKATMTTAIDWVSDNLANLWDLHTEALRTRSSYRAEIVALVIAIVGLLSIRAPLSTSSSPPPSLLTWPTTGHTTLNRASTGTPSCRGGAPNKLALTRTWRDRIT